MAHSLDLLLLRAAPGFGKSTALEAARPRDGVIVSAREALADLPVSGWLGIDDLHELEAADQLRLLAAVAAHPPTSQVVVTSRDPLPEGAHELQLRVRERGPEDLALDPYDVRRVLLDEYGVVDPEVPVVVQALTAGWPTLVHFAADALARTPGLDAREALTSPASSGRTWLLHEVLPTLSAAARRVIACLAGLGPLSPDVLVRVAEALGLARRDWFTELVSVGVLTPLHGFGRDGLAEVVPVVGDVLASDAEPPAAEGLRAASAALAEAGLPYGAALACMRVGDAAAALALVADRGETMLRRGHAAGVLELVAAAPAELVTDPIRMTVADALWICGDLAGAARAYRPLVTAAEAPGGAGWTPALAGRVAAVHYAAGRLEAALETLTRAEPAVTETDTSAYDEVETIEWLAWRVHVLCSLGRVGDVESDAAAVLALAEASGEPRALGAAHLAMARASRGERKEAHHEFALQAAVESADVITASRILVNQSCRLLATARYADATRAARSALQAADLGIATGRRAAALHNLAEALMERGEYDEASWHLLRATALGRRLGTGKTALGLLGLAEIDRRLGHDRRARARYHEATELARGNGETQVLVPALAGLARLWTPEEPATGQDEAQAAAAECLREASGEHLPFALTGAGWVALRSGDRAGAADLARRSVAAARDLQAYDLLADALELSAAAADRVDDARRDLAEALAIWSEGGALPAAARVEVQLGRLEGADGTERSRARDAARTLQRLGVRHVHGLPVTTTGAASVEIAVLGGFRVGVEGAEVPLPAWRSRQARTLVKILAARRGRPATRDWLCETLWPDDDPSRTGHRLSVLLATVRGVLDPERRWPKERFVAADPSGVWLELGTVTLDLDVLIRDADLAARLMDSGEPERAAEILADIDARYAGDPFEDDPAEEWADAAREEVRAAWQRSVRRLASLRRKAGRVGDYQTLLVKLLTADRYDDTSHRLLVASLVGVGRHGEARRAFDRWAEAMCEIGAPAPDPTVLQPRARRRSLQRAHVRPIAL